MLFFTMYWHNLIYILKQHSSLAYTIQNTMYIIFEILVLKLWGYKLGWYYLKKLTVIIIKAWSCNRQYKYTYKALKYIFKQTNAINKSNAQQKHAYCWQI